MNKLCQCFRPAFLAAVVVAALIAVTGCGPRDFVIAERGKPADCTIVCGEDADPAVRYAAEELRDYVKKLTDVELPIDGEAQRKIVISEGGLCDVPSDGFAILATEDDVLRISGTNPRGCIYGVYDLLERYGGVGFYSSWCEKVPRLDRLAVPAMSVNMSARRSRCVNRSGMTSTSISSSARSIATPRRLERNREGTVGVRALHFPLE